MCYTTLVTILFTSCNFKRKMFTVILTGAHSLRPPPAGALSVLHRTCVPCVVFSQCVYESVSVLSVHAREGERKKERKRVNE